MKMGSTDSAPPVFPISDTDHKAVVVVASLASLVYALLAVIAKNVIRLSFTSAKLHDFFLLLATVFLVAETVCVIQSCKAGLGQHIDTLAPDQLQNFTQLIYVATLLALLTQACAKISVCLLISVVANHGYPWNQHRVIHGLNQNRLFHANRILFCVIIVWFITGFFSVAITCAPGKSGAEQCLVGGPLYTYDNVMDLLTDLCLCIMPVAMMWKVQTSTEKKLQVIGLFGTRILVPMATIPSIVITIRHRDDKDVTWYAVASVVWFQIGINMSVLTACMPSLKSFVDSLLGETAGARIMAPYELEYNSENGMGLRSALAAAAASIYRSNVRANQAVITADRRQSNTERAGSSGASVGRTDSTRQLTSGVIHRTDQVDVTYTKLCDLDT